MPNHLLGIKNVGSTVQPIFQVFASNHWGRILLGLGTQFYTPSDIKTQVNIVPFCFWADWVILGSTKNSAILLQYPTFEAGFFHVFMGKIMKKFEFL